MSPLPRKRTAHSCWLHPVKGGGSHPGTCPGEAALSHASILRWQEQDREQRPVCCPKLMPNWGLVLYSQHWKSLVGNHRIEWPFLQEESVCGKSKSDPLVGWKVLEGGAGPLSPRWGPSSAPRPWGSEDDCAWLLRASDGSRGVIRKPENRELWCWGLGGSEAPGLVHKKILIIFQQVVVIHLGERHHFLSFLF